MTDYLSIEMLAPTQIREMADELEKMFDLACEGNDVANDEMEGKDIVEHWACKRLETQHHLVLTIPTLYSSMQL